MSQRVRRPASPLQPPRERGTGRAFALAALIHVLLALFLYHGVQWQNSTPAGAEAELWTEVPDSPTPRPVPPVQVAPAPPPARDDEAEIALQQKRHQQQEAAAREAQLAEQRREQAKAQQEAEAKRAALAAQQLAQQQAAEKQQQADKLRQQQLADQQKKLEQQQKLEQQRKQAQAKTEAAAKAKADAAKARLDKERQARLAQLQGQVGGDQGGGEGLAKSGTGTGSGGNAASSGYADKVKRRVKPNIIWNGERSGLETRVQVRCSPSGDVLGVTVTRPSSNAAWDDAVVNAVRASSPLPPDINGSTPPNITITFRAAE